MLTVGQDTLLCEKLEQLCCGPRIKDPEMGSSFWNAVESLEALSSMGRLQAWKTKKQLEDRYGDELQILLDDNSFLVRPNPLNPKLKLYLDREDSMKLVLNKGSKYSCSNTSKISKEQLGSLKEAFQGDIDEDMLDDLHNGMFGQRAIMEQDEGCEAKGKEQHQELETQSFKSLPPALMKMKKAAASAGSAATQPPATDSKDKKNDPITKLVDDFSQGDDMDWSVVSKLQTLMHKGKISLSSNFHTMKQQELQPDKATKAKISKSISAMEALSKKIDDVLVKKNGKKKVVINMLMSCVELYREGASLNQLLQAFGKRGAK